MLEYHSVQGCDVLWICLQDKLDDMEEEKYSIQKELKEKQRQLDAEKRIVKTKQSEVDRLKEMMHQRDELLKVWLSTYGDNWDSSWM